MPWKRNWRVYWVVLRSDPSVLLPVIEVVPGGAECRYRVFQNNAKATYYESQLQAAPVVADSGINQVAGAPSTGEDERSCPAGTTQFENCRQLTRHGQGERGAVLGASDREALLTKVDVAPREPRCLATAQASEEGQP